ncbi:Protein ImuA [Novosphingobium sp. 9U]|nr:protein ImuA [Novosphingobium sp. 9U]VWX49899.1 Protein ImuA [Novosphingobium sp. 9U]
MPVAAEKTTPSVPELRSLVGAAEGMAVHRCLPFGIEALDRRLGGEGLRAGALHEISGGTCSLVDDAAATLFIAGIAAREAASSGAPVLWASCRNDLYAPGVAQAGLHPAQVIHVQPRDEKALLAVVEDALRDGTPCAVAAEVRKVSMVASRRLQLAAADADIPVLLLRQRRHRERDPLEDPSAAWTRWRIGSAPSERLAVPGVARPRWVVELARQRGGDPFSLLLEGCDETGRLAVPAELGHRSAETVGTVRQVAA